MGIYGITVLGLMIFCMARGTYHIAANYTYAAIMSIATYSLGYAAMLKPAVVFGEHREKYHSGMSAAESSQLAEMAAWVYREKQLYLENGLRLNTVAEVLSTTPQKLSQAINQQFGVSFNEWTNHYRVDHARQLLSDPEVLKTRTIYSVALDSGFNSKSSFNDAFRKRTGKTPSAFADHQKHVRNDNNGRQNA